MSRIDVKKCGAAGDGIADDTATVQSAIDSCAKSGGGTVEFPGGTYLCATIVLRDNIRLLLDPSAQILGVRDPGRYCADENGFVDAVGSKRGQALVRAAGVRNVTIEGGGVIDGRGDREAFPGGKPRPMLLRFSDCENVAVRDIMLKDSAAWVQHYVGCTGLYLHNVRVHSYSNGNNDGIDIDGCSSVRISDCHIESGDDALTFKTTTDRPCRDVTVTNCVLSSECNALKFGTESIGGFENITIANISIFNTRLCGITVATVDGGTLQNIVVSNVVMRGVGSPFLVRLGNRGYHMRTGEERHLGALRGVTLRDIRVTDVRDIHGSAILGLPQRPIEDVHLSGVCIECPGGGTEEDASRPVEEEAERYPQYDKWQPFPARGLYCRHVKNITMDHVRFTLRGKDARREVVFEDERDA